MNDGTRGPTTTTSTTSVATTIPAPEFSAYHRSGKPYPYADLSSIMCALCICIVYIVGLMFVCVHECVCVWRVRFWPQVYSHTGGKKRNERTSKPTNKNWSCHHESVRCIWMDLDGCVCARPETQECVDKSIKWRPIKR